MAGLRGADTSAKPMKSTNDKKIYCIGCGEKVEARLTDGEEIYPHRKDLYSLPFWKCDACENYVGCHHKTKDRTRPLGVIPTKEIRNARIPLHNAIDPLWKSGKYTRKELYKMITEKFGWKYHTANIKSVEEANKILEYVRSL